MRRSAWASVAIMAPILASAHTGDHSASSFSAGLTHAIDEHWGWLFAIAVLAVVYAAKAALQTRAAKDRAERPPIR